MKKIFFILIGVLLFIFSCSKEVKNRIGDCSTPINPSISSAIFSSQGDSVIIKTENKWWWINHIMFEDSVHYISKQRKDTIHEKHFLIQKRDKKTLFVKFNKNKTSHKRKMQITLQAGNCFDNVTITQSAQ